MVRLLCSHALPHCTCHVCSLHMNFVPGPARGRSQVIFKVPGGIYLLVCLTLGTLPSSSGAMNSDFSGSLMCPIVSPCGLRWLMLRSINFPGLEFEVGNSPLLKQKSASERFTPLSLGLGNP